MKTIINKNLLNSYEEIMNTKYGDNEKLIYNIIKKYPENKELDIIALKITLIDSTCSTNLSKHTEKISIYDIAKIIQSNEIDFDNRVGKIENNEPEKLVEDILNKMKKDYGRNLFSFVTKYCCYHNNYYGKDDYSIYDSRVRKNLGYYIYNENEYTTEDEYEKTLENYGKQIDELRDKINYKEFNTQIETILDKNNIKLKDRRRKFDYHIWWEDKK